MVRNDTLTRLVYRSLPLASPGAVLLDIVRAAEQRNRTLGCSGVLVFDAAAYAQMIEGPSRSVESLKTLIWSDLRHVVTWSDWAIIDRYSVSADLPMGYMDPSELHRAGLPAPSTVGVSKMDFVDTTLWLQRAAVSKYPSAEVPVPSSGLVGRKRARWSEPGIREDPEGSHERRQRA